MTTKKTHLACWFQPANGTQRSTALGNTKAQAPKPSVHLGFPYESG
jgi:hypothetical protein